MGCCSQAGPLRRWIPGIPSPYAIATVLTQPVGKHQSGRYSALHTMSDCVSQLMAQGLRQCDDPHGIRLGIANNPAASDFTDAFLDPESMPNGVKVDRPKSECLA